MGKTMSGPTCATMRTASSTVDAVPATAMPPAGEHERERVGEDAMVVDDEDAGRPVALAHSASGLPNGGPRVNEGGPLRSAA